MTKRNPESGDLSVTLFDGRTMTWCKFLSTSLKDYSPLIPRGRVFLVKNTTANENTFTEGKTKVFKVK